MQFEISCGLEEEAQVILSKLVNDPPKENLSEALTNENCMGILDLNIEFKDNVRRGELLKTAQLWMQYMDYVWVLLRFLRVTKKNNFNP